MKLLFPDSLRDWLTQRYRHQHRSWLEGGGSWPLQISLGRPTQLDTCENATGIRAWVDAWMRWEGIGELRWTTRKWGRLGAQRLPSTLTLESPRDVAAWVGESRRWERTENRYATLGARWPQLLGKGMARHFDALADYDEGDYARLLNVLAWLLANPSSDFYVRQLPIAGVHTKWIESRKRLIGGLVASLRGILDGEFHAVCGIRRPPARVRFRLLCPHLRAHVGGLHDMAVSMEQLNLLDLKPQAALIVENQETGVALPELPGIVAFIGMGNAIAAAANVAWLPALPAVYWGDLDTFGLAILSRARHAMPKLHSVLMDEATLLAHRDLWVEEKRQHGDVAFDTLTAAERALFDKLRNNHWDVNVRLEQERLPWPMAMDAIGKALDAARPR
jgi:hypothetical protein